MGLLGKLVHDAVTTSSGLVEKEKKALIKEAAKLQTGELSFTEVQLQAPGDQGKEGLKTALGLNRQFPPEMALIAGVPATAGEVRIVVPFNGKDVLPTQMVAELNVGAPAAVALVRSLMGSWGEGTWVPANDQEPAGQRLSEVLEEVDKLKADIEWNHELSGDYVLKLDWTMQLLPRTAESCLLAVETAPVGIFKKNHGLEGFLKKLPLMHETLANISDVPVQTHPAPPIYPSLMGLGLSAFG